uniref:Uncharacterized protein n=1 Tax=Aegilops tauschii TaxID=37682 RepID=R7WEI8_AEGTA
MGAPLPSPTYADDEQTDFVLIKKFGYVADREDATTATDLLQGPDLKGSIKVTFCAACPPRISYFCVHATEYGRADLDLDPSILATEGPLVLLSAFLPSSSDMFHPVAKEYFVYHAGTSDTEGEGKKKASRPSLMHLPNPGRHHEFVEASATLLRTCSEHHSSSGSTLLPHGGNQEDHNCEACEFVIAAKRSARVRSVRRERGIGGIVCCIA